MVSIIIPTLAPSTELNKLVQKYVKYDYVEEIIIICNGFNWELNIQNVSSVSLPKNIYVNPAWNLGVELSRSKYTVLLNDDFVYIQDLHRVVISALKSDKIGAVGLSFGSKDSLHSSRVERRRNYGWGTCIGFKTDDFVTIPNYLKIYNGDDFIFYKMKLPNYSVTVEFPNEISASSSNVIFNNIKIRDVRMYKKLHWQDKYLRDLRLLWSSFQLLWL
jgi:hypothetical protein